MIADSIKSGLLGDLKETFPVSNPLDPKSLTKTKKKITTSTGPDLPLSTPLDPEHARNHREALEYEKNKKIMDL